MRIDSMPDIRLVRRRRSQLWLWSGILAAAGIVTWAAAAIFGDPTAPSEPRRVGAAAQFGAERAPVLPIEPIPFDSLAPLSDRDLGRLVRVTGVVESAVVRGAAWLRATDGRRILIRVEPLPAGEAHGPLTRGGQIELAGYLQNISRAEFVAWMDSLGVAIPRPPPAPRFGQLPDPEFRRLEARFIRNYYISVRPEQLSQEQATQTAARPEPGGPPAQPAGSTSP